MTAAKFEDWAKTFCLLSQMESDLAQRGIPRHQIDWHCAVAQNLRKQMLQGLETALRNEVA